MPNRVRQICIILSFTLILCLSAGCESIVFSTEPTISEVPTGAFDAATTAPQPEATAIPTEAPSTEPEHSALYIPGLCVEDVILYFNEVCLDSEFMNGGDPSFIQKWTVPICYALYGDYTEEDLTTLSRFVHWLNTIDGFPGMHEAQTGQDINLRIHFCSQSEMSRLMGDNFSEMDGGVTFWYSSDRIYDAIICYRSDLDQYLRNSVILEEIYNGLGPVQDTVLRPDSIIYQDFSQPQHLTAIDELLLRLLYHPDILPGMNAQQCEQVIRTLYY